LTNNLYVTDARDFSIPNGAIIRVNGATGAQTLIHSGSDLIEPIDVAIEASGKLVVSDLDPFTGGAGSKIVRMDPTTGAISLISSGGLLQSPAGLVIFPEPASSVLLGIVIVGYRRSRRKRTN
jgi:hypothetical protein